MSVQERVLTCLYLEQMQKVKENDERKKGKGRKDDGET